MLKTIESLLNHFQESVFSQNFAVNDKRSCEIESAWLQKKTNMPVNFH